MDLKEDEINNIGTENIHCQCSKSDNAILNTDNPHLPLNDINNINPRESIHSLERAQKIWIENSKSWPVKDQIQNAQIQWLKDFSSGTKFLCTSTPQAKKKEVRHTLPWTPPKSAADVCPRRGVCIYKPGYKNVGGNSLVVEKGNSVKIARLEEPVKVSPVKKPPEDKSKQHFSKADGEEQKSPKRRYITVRKKLERLRKSVIEGEQDQQNKEKLGRSSPDKRDNEKGETTREYIIRKREERERKIENERRKDAKAEAEKKARMARLRETQQRLIRNALKRQTPEKKPISRDDSPEPLWEDLPDKVMNRKNSVSPAKAALVKASPRSLSFDNSEIVQENSEVKAVDDPLISELILDSDIPAQKKMALLDRIEEGAITGKDTLLDIITSKEYLALIEMSPKRFTPDLSKAPSYSSRLSALSQSPSKFYDNSKAESITNCSVYENSASSIASSSKGSINVLQYIKGNSQNIPDQEQLAKISSIWQGEERSYNILRAVSNKHAAFDYFEKEYANDIDESTQQRYPSRISKSFLPNDLKQSKFEKTQQKVLNEKGIQCKVEDSLISTNPDMSSDFAGSSSFDRIGIHSTQSEKLRKPNVVLTPGRCSDPCFYQSPKPLNSEQVENPSQPPLKYGDYGFFDNLIETDIDPPLDPTERREVVSPTNFVLKGYTVSTNTKGRTQSDVTQNKLHIDPLSVPKDCHLSSNKADPDIIIKKLEEFDHLDTSSLIASSNLNIPRTLNLRTSLTDEAQKKLPVSSSVVMNSSNDQLHLTNKVKRIEEEIKILDSIHGDINVLEKNRSFHYEKETTQKDINDEGLVEASPNTLNAINNELSKENCAIRGSQSSSSFDIQSEDISGTSISKFSLNMFNDLLKSEECLKSQQFSELKKILIENLKADMVALELEKKEKKPEVEEVYYFGSLVSPAGDRVEDVRRFKELGNEEGVRNIRKKKRGLILKLDHDLEEIGRIRKEHRKKRQIFEKINNPTKVQLKMQSESQKGGISTKDGFKLSSNAITEPKNTHALLEMERKELELRENAVVEKLAELEKVSSWKQCLMEKEKKIQELEALLKPNKNKLVERGTSPIRITSDESQGEGQKAGGSYSDTFDQASSSSAHEKLEVKSTRKVMAIKVPLSPIVTLKRRHSSGSDESLLYSQTETQSEASDMEVRVLALEQQLKQRKAKLESLHREHKKSQKERLIAKEKSLLSQIQAYDLYITQVQKELEKEKEIGNIKIVKPLIKQPRIQSDRRKSDTWLIQDRKNKVDGTKHSIQSTSSLGVNGDIISKILKDKHDSKVKKASDKHSLKQAVLTKVSCSDPNLINSSDEKTGLSKFSYSSNESYESDIDKGKGVRDGSNSEHHSIISIDSALQPLGDSSIIKDKVDSKEYERNIGNDNDIIENVSHHVSIVAEEKDDSEENTLTQASIISKVAEDEDISHISSNNSSLPKDEIDKLQKEVSNISLENETQLESTSPKEDDREIISSHLNNETDNAKDLELVKQNASNMSSEHDVIVDKSALSEIVSEKEPSRISEILPKSDMAIEEVSLSEIEYDKTSQSEIVSERIETTNVISEKLNEPEGISMKSDVSDMASEMLLQPQVISERIDSEIISEKYDHSEVSGKEVDRSESSGEEDNQTEVISEKVILGINQSESINEKLDQTEMVSENLEQSERISEKSDQSVAVSEILEQSEMMTEKGSHTENSEKEQSTSSGEEINRSQMMPDDVAPIVRSDISENESNEQGSKKTLNSAESHSSHTLKGSSDISIKIASEISEVLNEENQTVKDVSEMSQSSKAMSEDNDSEVKEPALEESVKEITYLEVSDHVFQQGTGDKESEDEVSEQLSEKRIESKSLAEELEEVLDELEDDHLGSSLSEEQEKSTFHSASNAEEIFSKENSEDSSDGSFPLPVSNQLKKKLISKNEESESNALEIVASEVSYRIESEKGSPEIMSGVSEAPVEKFDCSKDIREKVSSKGSQSTINVTTDSSDKNIILSDKAKKIHEIENVSVETVSSHDSSEKIITLDDDVDKEQHEIISGASDVPSDKVSTHYDNSDGISLNSESAPKVMKSIQSSHIEQQSLIEIDEGKGIETHDGSLLKSLNKEQSYSNKDEIIADDFEEEKSFSESEVLHDSDVKSPLEELDLDDSFGGNSSPLGNLKLKRKFCGGQDYESASEPGEDSYNEEKFSEEDAFGFLSGQHTDQQTPWSQGTDLKTSGAPMIDALQREGESALDVLWRGIAESAIEEGKELVISTYLKKVQPDVVLSAIDSLDGNKLVGDNEEEEWDKEKLPRDQAAEAEVLRLQQLRIDKEIEELEEEEARRYYYVRPIPDKPPPPYTPRRSSLVSSVVEAAGELWDGRMEAPASFMAGSHLREFIWDLAAELVLQANPPNPPSHPPWVRLRRARPKKPIKNKEDLLVEVEKEAKIYLGVEEREVRENLIIRWSRKRRDHVDEILVRESGEEEWEWTDFTEEENTVKNRIAEAIIQESLAEATAALALAFSNKFQSPTT